MKILHLTTHINQGGITQYIYSVGTQVVKRGHQVFVASSGGEMEKELKAAGLGVKTLPIRTKSELHPKIYCALPELMDWMRQERIDLIHAHTRITQVMSAWIQKLSGIPFVTTAHGFYKRRLGRMLFPAWGERVIVISEAVGIDLRETHHVSTDRIRVVYNGIDLQELVRRFSAYDPLKARMEFAFTKDHYVIGIVARLVPDKGHEYLIRAVKTLEFDIPNLRLLIVGDGRNRTYLMELTKKLNLEKKILFAGTLKDVAKPLAAIDLFILPAVWREGFGLSIVEAMACQRPVVVTNIWSLNTFIHNEVNGILVEPRDTEDLVRAIRLLFQNPALGARIGEAGKKTAEERFSLDRMVREIEAVYEEILSRYNKHRGDFGHRG